MDIYGDSSIFLKNSAEVLVIVLSATVHEKGRTIREDPEERKKMDNRYRKCIQRLGKNLGCLV